MSLSEVLLGTFLGIIELQISEINFEATFTTLPLYRV